ncbi:MAG: glycosyltransferase family 4 protein [Proteobacteria bacterium]|nr:glycosyltransferase family 4 protein [Pseudomonadota bacterium]
MKIILINHYAGSLQHGMEFRPYYLAREWVRAGHSVTILAGSVSHVRAHNPELPAAAGASSVTQWIDGIEYRWYRVPEYQGNGVGRVRNIAAFLWQVWRAVPSLAASNPDVVVASSTYPMDIWVARRLARRAGAKLVFEVHDLWPLSPIELGGMSPSHPFIRVCQAAENAAYRDADAVVSMLPKVHDHMAGHGLDLRKLAIVPNGVDPDEWSEAAAPLRADLAETLAEARAAGQTVVGYAGSHGRPNALEHLLEAADLLRGEPFRFVLVGDGMEKPQLRKLAAQKSLTNVVMADPIPKNQVPAFLAAIDIAYIGWQRVPIYRFGIAPNKLMDYMMAGCVVLHSVEAGNDPVSEAGCGRTVPPVDAQSIAQGLRELQGLPPEERRAMGERGRAYVLANHAYPVLARRFLEALA